MIMYATSTMYRKYRIVVKETRPLYIIKGGDGSHRFPNNFPLTVIDDETGAMWNEKASFVLFLCFCCVIW